MGAVYLQISDLRRSVDYYQGVLGIDVLEHDAGRASVGVRGAAPLAYLVENKGVSPVSRRGRFSFTFRAPLARPSSARADLQRTESASGCVRGWPTIP